MVLHKAAKDLGSIARLPKNFLNSQVSGTEKKFIAVEKQVSIVSYKLTMTLVRV